MAYSVEVKIPVPWGEISGKWWGPEDEQPVLALHGWQENAGSFDRLIPLLPLDLAVLCVDMPGHGFSSPYPKGMNYYLFWDAIMIVRRIVRHFKWKYVSIMGHSMGGAIGFMYAASYPNEVNKLISFDIVHPSIRKPSKIVSEIGATIDKLLDYEQSNRPVPSYGYTDMLELVFDRYQGSLTRESAAVLLRRGIVPSVNSGAYEFTRDIRLRIGGLGSLSIDLVMEFASKITCEVMNIQADNGLVYYNDEYYHMVLNKIKETAKKCEYHLVPGTHHFHLNTPEIISQYVADFLAS